MSSFAVLALAAGLIAAAIPTRGSRTHRLSLAAVTAFFVLAIGWLWPESAATAPAVAKEAAEGADASPSMLLNLLIGLPIGGAIALLFLPRQMLSLVRGFTYAIFAGTFLLSLWLLSVPMTDGWHFQYIADWIPIAGIRYHVALDGISLWLVVLTTFTTPIAAFASFGSIDKRIKELCIAFLMLQGAMIGTFVALDLFLFYVFWELMLIPMFLLIGIWGGAERRMAAMKFFIYTMAGSVLMLAAILYLVWTHHELNGFWTFDYLALCQVVLPGVPGVVSAQALCFWAFTLAFFIKVPVFPLHTWLPDAHVQAPTGGSVVLAAVMLKMGTYGYLRFSMGLFPAQAATAAATLAGLVIMFGIIYGALCAWKQSDVKRLVAYSSVAHLGFVMLGLFGATTSGIKGAVLQMVNHGIATGALFMLVGVIYDRRHTREVSEFGGLAKVMPVYATLFIIVTMASIGVPGTNGFVGEFMVIAGTFVSERLNQFGPIQAVAAAFGVILAAVYMLGVVQKMFFGPLSNPKNKTLKDISPRESLALAPLILVIFLIGWFPQLMLDRMDAAVQSTRLRFVNTVLEVSPNPKAAQSVPPGVFSESFLKGAPKKPSADTKKKKVAMRPTKRGGAK